MNLKNRKVKIEYNGKTIVYDTIKEASESTGIYYGTLMKWLKKKVNPSIDIKISYVDDERLLRN